MMPYQDNRGHNPTGSNQVSPEPGPLYPFRHFPPNPPARSAGPISAQPRPLGRARSCRPVAITKLVCSPSCSMVAAGVYGTRPILRWQAGERRAVFRVGICHLPPYLAVPAFG